MAAEITTVLGPVAVARCGVIDAHNHLWIDPIMGVDASAPVLTGFNQIAAELIEYQKAGGFGVVDCQPGGCGRNANRLVDLSRKSGVAVIAATGFHRRRYYPPNFWLWSATSTAAAEYMIEELKDGIMECRSDTPAALAGFIKVACEEYLSYTPQAMLEGAAAAALHTGAMLQIHTEKGQSAEDILAFFLERGIQPSQVVLCHMDKRPDRGLHREIAQTGALLEYDTFYRPHYDPDNNLWPLLEWMITAGFEHTIALATDMADKHFWRSFSGGPGLPGFIKTIRSRLEQFIDSANIISQLLGKNIARRLAGLT